MPEFHENAHNSIDESVTKMEFLTFFLNNEEYGINILSVKEIRSWEQPTPVPNSASFLKGVINLRGIVIPVVDLRTRLMLPPLTEITSNTVIIVTQISNNSITKTIGLVVDRVSDVYNISFSEFQQPPNIGTVIASDLIKGIITIGSKVVIIVNETKFLDFDEGKL